MKFLKLTLISLALFSFMRCKKDTTDLIQSKRTGNFSLTNLLLQNINPSSYHPYINCSYDPSRNSRVFDLIAPVSNQPTPLVIYIHGGGFKNGSKGELYHIISPEYNDIRTNLQILLNNKVAVANINYPLLKHNDPEGILKCLESGPQFVQYIKAYASTFNIDPDNIFISGMSAGAGIAMYTAFHKDFQDLSSNDPIKKMSSRVKAVGIANPQSTYNYDLWQNNIFSEITFPNNDLLAYLPQNDKITIAHTITHSYAPTNNYNNLTLNGYKNEVDLLQHLNHSRNANLPIWGMNNVNSTLVNSSHRLLHNPVHMRKIKQTIIALNPSTTSSFGFIHPSFFTDNMNTKSWANFVQEMID